MQRKDVAGENRILSRERDRRRVENLVPISGTAKRGKQVAAIESTHGGDQAIHRYITPGEKRP
jgi:hypothetical protein